MLTTWLSSLIETRVVKYLESQSKFQLLEHAAFLYLGYHITKTVVQKGVIKSLTDVVKSTAIGKRAIQSTIDAEVEKTVRDLFPQNKSSGRGDESTDFTPTIPDEGLDLKLILQQLEEMKLEERDIVPSEGKTWAYVYEKSSEHSEFITKAHNLFIHTNALSPMAFSSLRRMENEIVEMCKPLFHSTDENDPDLNVVGTLSSGGTESLELMLLTYRDRSRALKPHITNPEVVLCETAHPAIYKAAHYFGVKLVFVPCDPSTMSMDIGATEKAITKNTILLVGSAPQYPHGVIDPISKLSDLALKYDVALHVDSCIGGFVLPFMEKLGYQIEIFDFRLKGVTSISADLHKYGYAPKGASLILYRNPAIRKYQFYAATSWPGGFYISPTLMGTRGGGPIAGAWASIKAMGMNGFLSSIKSIMEATEYLRKEISTIPDLEIIGAPVMTILSFKTRKNSAINIYAVADRMEKMGWHIDRQRNPDAIHITVMPQHLKVKEQFISDVRESVEYVKSHPSEFEAKGTVAMYGMIARVENADADLLEDFLISFLDRIYRI